MACENCKYWKPEYAKAADKIVMTCTIPTRSEEAGRCSHFKRKFVWPKEEPSKTALFRYKEGK